MGIEENKKRLRLRSFCYLLLVHPCGIDANTRVRFYDSDCDGKFESVVNGDSLF
jgi:hypothetical protein